MKRYTWLCSGLLGAAALTGSASAQGVHGALSTGHAGAAQACPAPAPVAAPPADAGAMMPGSVPAGPGAFTETPAGTQQQQEGTGSDRDSSVAGLGGLQNGGFGNTLTTGGIGSGTAMMGGGVGGTFAISITVNQTSTQSPLILPGLFTAARAEPAHPFDRVFFDYGYADRFKSVTPTGLAAGFNLHTWDVGGELTFLDGRASVYARAPYLLATDNTTSQGIDGIGDVSAGLKFVILGSPQTGSVLTGGMTVSAPTGRDDVVRTTTTVAIPSQTVGTTNSGTPVTLSGMDFAPTTTTTKVNPTILQPYMAGLLVLDRFYVQEFIGVVIPTDSSVATFINNDLTIGYQVYRKCGGLLTSVTPTFDVQLLSPVTHRGVPQNGGTRTVQINGPSDTITINPDNTLPLTAEQIRQLTSQLPSSSQHPTFGFPDQVFLTEGLEFGIGERSLFSVGVVEPVSGPKAFSIGAVASFNYFF